jgi:hypothetical protein
VPDLVTAILILAGLVAIVGAIIWNLDRFRNEDADPLVNPAWTILARPSQRWHTKKRSKPDVTGFLDTTDPGRGHTTADGDLD